MFKSTSFYRKPPMAASELTRSRYSSTNYRLFRKSLLIVTRPYERKICYIAEFVRRNLLCSFSIEAGTTKLFYVLSLSNEKRATLQMT